jgi:hypothetical protein
MEEGVARWWNGRKMKQRGSGMEVRWSSEMAKRRNVVQ